MDYIDRQRRIPAIVCGLFTVVVIILLYIPSIDRYFLINKISVHHYREPVHKIQRLPINISTHESKSTSKDSLTIKKQVRKENVERNSSCDLCNDYNWVFILATGRSGSTTILDMLHGVEGVQLAGELKLMYLFNQLPYVGGENKINELKFGRAIEKAGTVKARTKGAFKHGEIDLHRVYCDIQKLIRDLIGYSSGNTHSPKVVGFKSLFANPTADGDALLQFWTRVFPCARFILNYRVDTVIRNTINEINASLH
uniref:Uncharacterized protein n=1 Tax=Aplanochytrium stocchinoi TaxID=215587 RepID=A0A7S3PHM8_9STRA